MGWEGFTKAVILAGGRGTAALPLANHWPKLAFPIGPAPLLTHMLSYLRKNGIRDVAVLFSEHKNWSKESLPADVCGPQRKMSVTWHFDNGTKGTAGALKAVSGFVGTDDFLVLQANLYIESLNLAEIARTHRTRGSGLTIVVEPRRRERMDLEQVEIDGEGRVARVDVFHRSCLGDEPLSCSGVYAMNPRVLTTFDDEGYVDIKEQLLPLLQRSNIPVHAVNMNGVVKRVNTLDDYLRLSGEYLFNGVGKPDPYFEPLTEIRPRVWVGSNVRISPEAYLLGPLVIGEGCMIDDHAEVIGPASIGQGTRLEANSHVRESIVWPGCRVGKGARVEFSVIAGGHSVPEKSVVHNAVVVKSPDSIDRFERAESPSPRRFGGTSGAAPEVTLGSPGRGRGTGFFYPAVKRGFDLILSAVSLILLAPLLLLLAAFIKLTSRGPVFFHQTRCGLGGKEFRIHKFRTMIVGAERLQERFSAVKETDGPMFKLELDPRVTAIGRVLRRTSLDELPQLFNVFKGQMSLVGPRPLAMDEMRCSPSWRDIRLSVKPGITGLWQVEGRDSPYFHDWIEYDVHYALRRSLWLDFKILLKTLGTAVVGNGAK